MVERKKGGLRTRIALGAESSGQSVSRHPDEGDGADAGDRGGRHLTGREK
jgi:hypothetical protein